MNRPETGGGVGRTDNAWKSKSVLPVVTCTLLSALLLLDLPSLFRSPLRANSDAAANSIAVLVPNQPFSGGIYAPQPANRLGAQAGTHLRVDGWLGIRDPKLTVRRVIATLDSRPLRATDFFLVRADPSVESIRCECSDEIL